MTRRMTWILVMLAVVLVVPSADATTDAATRIVRVDGKGQYTNVTAAGLSRMLERKDFLLVNVHVPYEGDISGTDVSIPFDQVAGSLDRFPADKDGRILVYCRSGRMSAIAATTLVGLGYRDVWNLEGGMAAWERAGNGLVKSRR